MVIADVASKSLAEITSLAGRVAIVTGGAQGLGRASARRLAEAGASVLIGDLKEDVARKSATELAKAYNRKVIATRLDVTDPGSVAAAALLAKSELGGLDIWVNNAGVYPNVMLMDMTPEAWDQVMAVNVRGVFLGAREAARHMIESGRGGVIVNIVSVAGFTGVAPGISAYVASKFGARGLTAQMALELAPHGIRVLGVAPTFCKTEGNMEALEALASSTDRDVRSEISASKNSRLGRIGVPDDIGRVVLFCACDMSNFMTGSTLLADAGELA